MDVSDTEKIGILGGTFNPVHIGHIGASKLAAERLGLKKLIFIPNLTPPHKELPEETAPAEMRLEMLRLAVGDMEEAEVSDIEIKRGGVSYTADTVELLKKRYPDAEFWLLLGNDMLSSFEQWYRFEWLCENVSLCALSRYNDGGEQKAAADRLREKYGARIEFAGNDTTEISSTDIREMLKKRGGRRFLMPGVYDYIVKNRLYGVKPEFDWLRAKAMEMLEPKRISHVMGCESEAVALAERWHADKDDARCAAILHDITKKLDLNEQLIICRKYGIMTDAVEMREVKLLHSKTGAALAGDIFGMPEAVCDAIRWHTTGKADMSLLEKIIYLADYIEPGREFDGVGALRELAYRDLDAAMLLGLEMSEAEIRERGKAVHRNTLSAIEYLKRSIKA